MGGRYSCFLLDQVRVTWQREQSTVAARINRYICTRHTKIYDENIEYSENQKRIFVIFVWHTVDIFRGYSFIVPFHLETTMDKGWSALTCAVIGGHPTAVQLLLDRGFFPSAVDIDGHDAVWHALQNGHADVANILARYIDARSQNNALVDAVEQGNLNDVRALLLAGVDVNVHDSAGRLPLCVAAKNGHVHILSALIDAGADVNAVDYSSYKKNDTDEALDV